MRYNVEFVCKKILNLMQKVHDKNMKLMKSFFDTLTGFHENNDSFFRMKNKKEELITDLYDEDFLEDELTEENDVKNKQIDEEKEEMKIVLNGHERVLFEYIRDQIEEFHKSENEEIYSINIASDELQQELELGADQVSRALWKLSKKNILKKRGYFSSQKYYYEFYIPAQFVE